MIDDGIMDGAPRRLHSRQVGLVLCMAAVGSFALALGTRSWWSHRVHHDTSIDVGLWSARACVGPYSSRYLGPGHSPKVADPRAEVWSACVTQRPGDLVERLDANRDAFIIDDVWGPRSPEQTHQPFTLLGLFILGVGLVAMLALVAVGVATGAGARRRAWRSVAGLAAYASGGFLLLAIPFALFAPPEIDQMSLGLGFAFALAGGGFGMGAGSVLSAYHAGDELRWHTPARDARLSRAIAVTSMGLLALALSLHTRTWWVDSDGNYNARHGIRDGESCEGEPRCEIETWNSQPAGATGPRPFKRLVAFRASEVAYQLGHLALLVGVLLVLLLLQGHLVTGRWAPHRILIATALGFLVAAVVLTLGEVPEPIDDEAKRSIGPGLALLGSGLLVWGGIAAARLTREPREGERLPPARVHRDES